jgi:hypothetical protein
MPLVLAVQLSKGETFSQTSLKILDFQSPQFSRRFLASHAYEDAESISLVDEMPFRNLRKYKDIPASGG